MFITVNFNEQLRYGIAAFLIISALVFLGTYFGVDKKPAYTYKQTEYTLVIDPGHGGVDGGAISASGAKESDINLSIGQKMGCLCDFLGIKTVKTRDSDTDNSNGSDYSEHNNLVARADLVNNTENAVLISVHQNKFPGESVRGAEIMYAATSGSKELGEITQNNLVSMLDTENRRVSRPAPKELLLTSNVNCPAILAECGFMSNPDEAQKLQDSTYQMKIAAIFVASFIQFKETQIPA